MINVLIEIIIEIKKESKIGMGALNSAGLCVYSVSGLSDKTFCQSKLY